MFHTTFSQGKYSTQGKGLFEPKCNGQDQDIVIESRRKGQEHSLLSEPNCKGQRYCRLGSKDRVTHHLYAY